MIDTRAFLDVLVVERPIEHSLMYLNDIVY